MNKNDRPLATLDNNPLIAYFKIESDAPRSPKDEADGLAVRELFEMQRTGSIRLRVGFPTALEKQRPGQEMEMPTYAARLEALGIDKEDIFTHDRTIAFSTPDAPGTMIFDFDRERMLAWRQSAGRARDIRLIPQPAYNLELNPMEHVWEEPAKNSSRIWRFQRWRT